MIYILIVECSVPFTVSNTVLIQILIDNPYLKKASGFIVTLRPFFSASILMLFWSLEVVREYFSSFIFIELTLTVF